MIFIKKFLDKLSVVESRNKDIVISMDDAKGLREDINNLLLDNYQLLKQDTKKEDTVQIVMNGGKW